jgi:hypothetical protein
VEVVELKNSYWTPMYPERKYGNVFVKMELNSFYKRSPMKFGFFAEEETESADD